MGNLSAVFAERGFRMPPDIAPNMIGGGGGGDGSWGTVAAPARQNDNVAPPKIPMPVAP